MRGRDWLGRWIGAGRGLDRSRMERGAGRAGGDKAPAGSATSVDRCRRGEICALLLQDF
jgi:hypothetical protein